MLVWQWFSSQGSAVRLLHRFLLWHCLLALTCWGFHFLRLQTLDFGAVRGACTPSSAGTGTGGTSQMPVLGLLHRAVFLGGCRAALCCVFKAMTSV